MFDLIISVFKNEFLSSSLPFILQWSERRRLDLAGFLSSMLRAHLNAYDPIFSMALRYLIRLCINFISFSLYEPRKLCHFYC